MTRMAMSMSRTPTVSLAKQSLSSGGEPHRREAVVLTSGGGEGWQPEWWRPGQRMSGCGRRLTSPI
jgi:hypothetical protein